MLHHCNIINIQMLPRPLWFIQFNSAIPLSTPPESIRIQLLQLCSPLLRTCFGCSQSLKPHGVIAPPPHDMVLVTRMSRDWPDKRTGEMRHSLANVYFHVNVPCVRMKQLYFDPQMSILPHAITAHLTPIHFHFLREFGLHLKIL